MKTFYIKLALIIVAVVGVGTGGVFAYYSMTQASDQQIKEAYQSIEKEKGYKFIKIHEKAKDSPEYEDAMSFLKIPTEYRLDDPKGMARSLKEADDNYFNQYSDYSSAVTMGEVSGYTLERWSKERLMESNDFTEEEVDAITPNRRRLFTLQMLAADAKAKTGEVPKVLQSALNAAVNMYANPKMEYSFEQEKFDTENQKAIYFAIDGAKKAYK